MASLCSCGRLLLLAVIWTLGLVRGTAADDDVWEWDAFVEMMDEPKWYVPVYVLAGYVVIITSYAVILYICMRSKKRALERRKERQPADNYNPFQTGDNHQGTAETDMGQSQAAAGQNSRELGQEQGRFWQEGGGVGDKQRIPSANGTMVCPNEALRDQFEENGVHLPSSRGMFLHQSNGNGGMAITSASLDGFASEAPGGDAQLPSSISTGGKFNFQRFNVEDAAGRHAVALPPPPPGHGGETHHSALPVAELFSQDPLNVVTYEDVGENFSKTQGGGQAVLDGGYAEVPPNGVPPGVAPQNRGPSMIRKSSKMNPLLDKLVANMEENNLYASAT